MVCERAQRRDQPGGGLVIVGDLQGGLDPAVIGQARSIPQSGPSGLDPVVMYTSTVADKMIFSRP